MRNEPLHDIARQHQAFSEAIIGWRIAGHIGDGIEQNLIVRHGKITMQRHQRQHGGQVATSAIAADGNTRAVNAKALCLPANITISGG